MIAAMAQSAHCQERSTWAKAKRIYRLIWNKHFNHHHHPPNYKNFPLYTLAFLKRKLLLTTNTLLNDMAAAARMGLRYPRAAAGIKITL